MGLTEKPLANIFASILQYTINSRISSNSKGAMQKNPPGGGFSIIDNSD